PHVRQCSVMRLSVTRLLVVAAALMFIATGVAFGQQPSSKVWRVGVLSLALVPSDIQGWSSVIESGMRERGYASGTIIVDVRQANGTRQRLAELAHEFADARVDVIVAPSNIEIAAAKQATNTIPIVMVLAVDPIGNGFASSLSRPGGNITGTTY